MVFTIPEWNKKDFLKKIASLQKKGLNVKAEEIGPTVYECDGIYYTCTEYEVSTEIVYQVPGWKFVGTIEHTDAGNIIRKAFDIEVPERYYTTPAMCEHCNTIRARKDTYLVCDDNGNFKQVGRACLKAYTGLDPYVCVCAMSIQRELQAMEADDEEIRVGGYYHSRVYKADYIKAITVPIIKEYGYVKAEDAYYSNTKPTRNRIIDSVGCLYVKEAPAEEIEEIDAWVNSLTPDNDYIRNASTAYKASFYESRDLALVASLINSFYKNKAYEARKAAQAAAAKAKAESSSYIGNIGDKITFTVKESRILYSCGSYSYYAPTTNAWEIIDTEGNVIIWKTAQAIKPGEVYKATVKEQKEYRGIPQTTITRGKLISGVEQAPSENAASLKDLDVLYQD